MGCVYWGGNGMCACVRINPQAGLFDLQAAKEWQGRMAAAKLDMVSLNWGPSFGKKHILNKHVRI